MGGANKEFLFDPKDPEDLREDEVKPGHRLLIKTAILMADAKKDEINVVQIETEGYKNKQVTMPIVAMMGGKDVQTYVDLLVPSYPATLKLVKGDGPVHLVGCHCVDYYGAQIGDDETEDEDLEEEKTEKEKGTAKSGSGDAEEKKE